MKKTFLNGRCGLRKSISTHLFYNSLKVLAALVLAGSLAHAQRLSGEIHLEVFDTAGGALPASGTLQSQATGVLRGFKTKPDGQYVFKGLPFGPYRLQVENTGFATQSLLIEINSETPYHQRVTLGVAPVETSLVVSDSATLNDPGRTGAIQYLGPEIFRDRRSTMPGRSVLNLVNTQPGWLLEANGILHPRGSEYDVQYVIDGVPLYDNRSPAFAQSLSVGEYESMSVRTGNFPAEFGRKMGGVIELATPRDARAGLHGKTVLQGGSFSQLSGYSSMQYTQGATTVGLSGEGMMTDRYLDPPVVENFTNRSSGGALAARLEQDWSSNDRTRFYFHHRNSGFLVPNELLQQSAGQRQDRNAGESLGQISHQHIFSPNVLGNVRAMVRDTNSGLWSNSLSTPILPIQDRGFRETYLGGNLTAHYGRHEMKAGVEALFDSIHENFSYHVTAYEINGVPIFDDDVPESFHFKDRKQGRDQSGYIQDRMRLGNLTLSAGLRFDHHRLAQDETAWSPRLGAAYYVPKLGLVLRASYDRVFTVPAIENILLASTNQLGGLGDEGEFLPLRSARGNYYEAGFSKSLFGKFRLDGTWYRRNVDNFADDELLFNTGVSFPIAFSNAQINGYEAKLELPKWGRFSGFMSYSNMVSFGYLPASGGLFLGDEAEELLEGGGKFPISQDQRNTFRARFRTQVHRRAWVALGGGYNSGLPFELEGVSDMDFVTQQYGPQILSKVNFERGRVRPSATIDVSGGFDILQRENLAMRVQADVLNVGDRLNLINYSGVLSGTALEPGRNFAMRLHVDF